MLFINFLFENRGVGWIGADAVDLERTSSGMVVFIRNLCIISFSIH